jgi:hypothetical protein
MRMRRGDAGVGGRVEGLDVGDCCFADVALCGSPGYAALVGSGWLAFRLWIPRFSCQIGLVSRQWLWNLSLASGILGSEQGVELKVIELKRMLSLVCMQ